MGDIIRLENYEIRECEVEHGYQKKAMKRAVESIAQGVAAMHNGAIMELLEALTHTTIKAIRPQDIDVLVRANGLNLQRIVFKDDVVAGINHADEVPKSGWYLFRRVDRGIVAFVSEPLIIRQDRKLTAKIFVWKSPRLVS